MSELWLLKIPRNSAFTMTAATRQALAPGEGKRKALIVAQPVNGTCGVT